MKALTHNEMVQAFKHATGGFHEETAALWREYASTGLTDAELADVLARRLGIFGGSAGPGQPHITYQGAGLKIWATWRVHNHHQEPPLFAGQKTIAMAREVYGIPDPENDQMPLL